MQQTELETRKGGERSVGSRISFHFVGNQVKGSVAITEMKMSYHLLQGNFLYIFFKWIFCVMETLLAIPPKKNREQTHLEIASRSV